MNNEQIRNILSELVSSENEDRWWRTDLFRKYTFSQIPSELKIIDFPPEEEKNYNCFLYALGLQNDQRFLGNAGWEFTRNLGTTFEAMIDKKILTISISPEKGDMILYRANDGSISHVGLVDGQNTVISKWSWGPIIKHSIFDVPKEYGDVVEYYKASKEARDYVIEEYIRSL